MVGYTTGTAKGVSGVQISAFSMGIRGVHFLFGFRDTAACSSSHFSYLLPCGILPGVAWVADNLEEAGGSRTTGYEYLWHRHCSGLRQEDVYVGLVKVDSRVAIPLL
jgi:hypothetical protein